MKEITANELEILERKNERIAPKALSPSKGLCAQVQPRQNESIFQISALLKLRNEIVQICVHRPEFLGLTRDSRTNLSNSFVCQHLSFFYGCHCAAFDSPKGLEDHELLQHTCGIRCMEESCSLSRIGFTSSKPLKLHLLTHHKIKETVQKPTSLCGGINVKFVCNDFA